MVALEYPSRRSIDRLQDVAEKLHLNSCLYVYM